ncbi:MAG: energy transducer TonB, partial [Bacteroidales bacterium]|nr:energy transducer TonB [Bacteroidales bacterium]
GDKGDVEVPEPPREKPIDNRALFSNPDNKTEKDTLAQHTSRDITEALEAGHPQGNVTKGPENGTPNANVEGRTVVNGLPRPAYNSNSDGTVVVDIEVDRAGKVIKAVAGGKGTNTSDQKLWNAAVEAAKQTKFNVKNDDPEKQPGKITYYFKFNQ